MDLGLVSLLERLNFRMSIASLSLCINSSRKHLNIDKERRIKKICKSKSCIILAVLLHDCVGERS